MNSMQRKIINDFKYKFGEQSYAEYSRITGIEKSRFFRICNGQELRITEWDKLKQLTYDNSNILSLFESHGDIGKRKNELTESAKRYAKLKLIKTNI